MSWSQELREAIAGVRAYVDRRFSEFGLGWTLTASNSAMGDADQVETGDGEDSQRPVRRIEPFGLRSRPPTKIRSLWFKLGSSNVVFLGIAPTKAYGPTNLAEGETALYNSVEKVGVLIDKDGKITINAGDSKVTITKDGAITVDAKSPADVVVNGGGAKVARLGDHLSASSALIAWAANVESAISGLGGVVPSPTFSGGDAGGANGLGTINEGAEHFMG